MIMFARVVGYLLLGSNRRRIPSEVPSVSLTKQLTSCLGTLGALSLRLVNGITITTPRYACLYMYTQIQWFGGSIYYRLNVGYCRIHTDINPEYHLRENRNETPKTLLFRMVIGRLVLSTPTPSAGDLAACLTLSGTMTTTGLSPGPLPCPPVPEEGWRPNYLSAYNTTLDAERHAVQQVEVNSSVQEAKDNVMFARVVGYFLLEFFKRRAILSEEPCASLAKDIESSTHAGGAAHEAVFVIGKRLHDCLLRMCAVGCFPILSRILVFLADLTTGGEYPTPSPPSRSSFDTLAEMTTRYMEADGNDYRTAKHKVRISHPICPPPSFLVLG